VENLTEINKKANVREDMLVREGMRSSAKSKGGKDNDGFYENVDILTDSKKKLQLLQDLTGDDELRAKLQQLVPTSMKLEL
jgi:hypothetical protein